jgi:hypothetical protein
MYVRKTIGILTFFVFLNLCFGIAASAASTTDGTEGATYSVSISKNAGTTVVKAIDGKTIYSGTNDAEAVRAALNSISQGAILFNPGTYTISSPISVKSNIELVSNGAVMKGYTIFRMNGATNVTIRGFEFTNPDVSYLSQASSTGLVDLINSNNCVIEENTFRNFRDYGINVAVSSTSQYNKQITIKNNNFLDYGYCGVMIGKQSNYIYVEDNTFKNINVRKLNGNAYGIAVAKGSNSYKHSEHIYIRNNWIENCPVWEGIDSHGANHVYILDNTVINCKVPIAVSYQTNEGTYPLPVHTIVITGNYVKGNMASPEKQHSGIHVLGARNNVKPYTNVTVSGNTVIDVNSWLVSDDGAIVLRDVDGVAVENNLISGVGGTAIYMLNTDKALVQNNDVKNIVRISGPTKGLKLMPVDKDCTTTVKNNKFDSSVEYHAYGYSSWGYKYLVSVLGQDTSKFYNPNGVLELTLLEESETPAADDTPSSEAEPEITPEAPTETMMFVSSFTATKEYSIKGKNTFGWAVATVKVVDQNGKTVPGATVNGSWSGLDTASVSRTTDTNGIVKFTSSKVKNPKGTLTFKVTGATHTGYTYNPSQNICSIVSVTF